MTENDREMGSFSARLEAIEAAVEDLDKTVGEIRDVMMMGRGLSRIGAYAGAVLLIFLGAFASQLVAWLWSRP